MENNTLEHSPPEAPDPLVVPHICGYQNKGSNQIKKICCPTHDRLYEVDDPSSNFSSKTCFCQFSLGLQHHVSHGVRCRSIFFQQALEPQMRCLFSFSLPHCSVLKCCVTQEQVNLFSIASCMMWSEIRFHFIVIVILLIIIIFFFCLLPSRFTANTIKSDMERQITHSKTDKITPLLVTHLNSIYFTSHIETHQTLQGLSQTRCQTTQCKKHVHDNTR